MQIERSIRVQASPERVYRIYENVPGWSDWDPDTKRAVLDGPFAVGSTGSLTPAKGRTVPMRLTHVETNRGFTVESRIPLFRMVFEHELMPDGDAIRVVHRATFSGFLAPLLGPLLVRQLDRGLPVTLDKLKRLAERGA